MNLYDITIPLFQKQLKAIDNCLGKAQAYADQRKFDVNNLMVTRLAPDQFTFAKQVQTACDVAKFAAAKLTGREAPSHPDTEKTIDELRARIKTVQDYLETFKREDFANAAEARCGHTWMGGKSIRGTAYVHEYVIPNFYFHAAHAYALLRHNGVQLGKFDYLVSLPME